MTLLHAVDIPPEGGDTLFCNMHMAYDALPPEEQKKIANLRAVHSWEASRRNTGNIPATERQKRERPPVSHPIVRTHPETGRKSLYIGMHTSHIEGISEVEGKNLLNELLEAATTSKNIYRHKWQSGDLVLGIIAVCCTEAIKTLRWTSIVEYFTAQWLKGRPLLTTYFTYSMLMSSHALFYPLTNFIFFCVSLHMRCCSVGL